MFIYFATTRLSTSFLHSRPSSACSAQLQKGSGRIPLIFQAQWELHETPVLGIFQSPKPKLPRDRMDLKGENLATTVSDDGLDTFPILGVGFGVGGEGSADAGGSANKLKVGAVQLRSEWC